MKTIYIGSNNNFVKDFAPIIGNDSSIEISQFDEGIETLTKTSCELIIVEIESREMGLAIVNTILATGRFEFPYILFLSKKHHREEILDILGPIPGDVVPLPIEKEDFQEHIEVAKRSIVLQNQLRDNKGYSEVLSTHDLGTNILNRQAIYQRALGELDRAQRGKFELTLGMLEICNLDEISVEFGEEIENQTISFVAHQLRSNVRLYDLVGRWMGTKFLIVLPGIPEEHNVGIILRLYQSIVKNPIRLENDQLIPVEIAIGYTWLEKDKVEPLFQLIDQANESLIASYKKDQLKISTIK